MTIDEKRIKISVLLLAHNRSAFIEKALNSLYYQTADRSKFEVIVVKNFLNERIDHIISLYEFINVFTEEKELTAKLKVGFNVSKGCVITILEDDDFYESKRLDILMNKFLNTSIIFYHNSFKIINSKEQLLKLNPQKNDMIFNSRSDKLVQLLDKAISYRGHHNLSSMAFERIFFGRVITNFPNLTYAVDLMFFLEAISSGRNVFFDSSQLTYYMKHESASTIDLNADRKSELDDRDFQTISILESLLQNESNLVLANKIRLMMIERKIYINVKQRVYDDKTKVSLEEVYLFLLDKLHYYNPESYFIVLLFILSKITHRLARFIFKKFSLNRINMS